MATINLKDFYYWYTQDQFIEVSDEVAEVFLADARYDFLTEGQYEDCNEALLRIVPRIRMDMIRDFLEDVPYLSNLQRTFYQSYIQARWEKLLLPAYDQAAGQTESH